MVSAIELAKNLSKLVIPKTLFEKFSITYRSKAVVLLWFSVACLWCQSFEDGSPYVCSIFSSVSVA